MNETERLLLENPAFGAWWSMARAYHSTAAHLTRLVEGYGITGPQFGVLRCVADAGSEGLMLSDLSRRLLVTCGNITGVVDRLEQAGYLRRERQTDDRRVVRARLTPEGQALYREVMPAFQALIAELMAPLSPEEQEALTRHGDALLQASERRRRDEEAVPVAAAGPEQNR